MAALLRKITDDTCITLICAMTVLFAFRVFAQLQQFVSPLALLPDFSVWQSGALPYPILLPLQLAVLAAMVWTCRLLLSDSALRSPVISRYLGIFSVAYIGVMSFRLIAGQTFYPDHIWLDAVLPNIFHFVLAAFLVAVAAKLNPAAEWINATARFTPRLVYPVLVILSLLLHRYFIEKDQSLLVSTMFPVTLAFAVIVLLEHLRPARSSWAATTEELKTDVTYLVVVQMLLPKLLLEGLAMVAVLAGILVYLPSVSELAVVSTGWPGSLWPHQWSVPVQALTMLLIADFFRYWLHRASHRLDLLWGFHAVHHAPTTLHASNVGRFHPLEKVIQLLVDTVPFVLVGVAPEVLAFYFVFYAVNGYLQHCNIDVRLGFLNYVISGPQLHRWHHSRDRTQAQVNFGNNTIVWDWIFGTAFYGRGVPTALGLECDAMPENFVAQTLAPLKSSQSDAGAAGAWRKIYSRIAIAAMLRGAWLMYAWPLLRVARRPRRTQERALNQILKTNLGCDFGQSYGFSKINSPAQFRSRVPIMYEDDLKTWLPSQQRGAPQRLTIEQPQIYARTSGTTGKPKDIPMTQSMLWRLRSQQCASLAFQYARCPQAFSGDLLAITSPASEGVAADGRSYGSASGHLINSTPKLLRDKAVLPPQVLAVKDPQLKSLLILRLALVAPDITFIGTANPSTLLMLLSLLNDNADALIKDVADGGFHRQQDLTPALNDLLRDRFQADPNRAAQIREIKNAGDRLNFATLWPKVKMLVSWTAAGGGIAMRALEQELPQDTIVSELGYIASEFRGTVTTAADHGLAVLEDVFYEFVEKSAWESGHRNTVLIHELSPQRQYYIIVTTRSGLYRYFMNDIVRVSGRVGRTPTLEFVQKGRGVTNITGEKLYEGQFIDALSALDKEFDLNPVYALLQADRHKARYTLYLEAHRANTVVRVFQLEKLAKRLDQLLAERNIEYRARRLSGRLKPLLFRYLLPGTERTMRAIQVKRGQREGQLKLPVLAYREDVPVALGDHEWGQTA